MSDNLTRFDLIKLHQELGDDDFGKLKYLSKDFISQSKETDVKTSLDLFSYLEEKRCINVKDGRYDFLTECLFKMERKDLIKVLHGNVNEIEKKLERGESIFSPYRSFLFLMSESMGSEEEEAIKSFLKRKFKVKKRALEKIDVWGLLHLIEQHVQQDSLPILEEICELFEDDAVKDGLEQYKKEISLNGRENREGNTASTCEHTRREESNDDGFPIPVSDANLERPSTDAASSIPVSESGTNASPSALCYDMHQPAGLCIIINNQRFDNSQVFPSRTGSDVDTEKLSSTFRMFGFEVKVHENATVDEMENILKGYAAFDHAQYSALVICVLSHGGNGFVVGRSGRNIAIDQLTSFFRPNECPSLSDKPKLFFIQACQGPGTQGVWYANDLPANEVESDVQCLREGNNSEEIRASDPSMLPVDADFLLGMATTQNHVSYRSSEGSFYIKSLTENLIEYSPREDLMSILTIVNNDVANMSGVHDMRIAKQIPEPRSRLRKKVYFYPLVPKPQ